MNFQLLETERLLLRKLTDEDYAFIIQNCSDTEAMELFGFTALEELAKEKSRQPKGYSTFNKSFLVFQLIEKESNKIIGWCGYHTWYRDHNRAELGYGLRNDEHKQKGFMTEAITQIIEFGWDEMHLHRIEAMAANYNIPSVKLLQNFGFVHEGTLKEHYLVNGVYENSEVFGLLKKGEDKI